MQFNIECQLCVELHVSQGAKEPCKCKGGSAHSKNGEKEMDMEMDTN